MSKDILIATTNTNKLREYSKLFKGSRLVPLDAFSDYDIPETGVTFEENAFIKADFLHTLTGMEVIAEDSGLCVDYLGGNPGVYSARYAGDHNAEHNNIKLLANMRNVPLSKRNAKYVTVICLINELGVPTYFRGECEGYIDFEERGVGFDYDTLFIPTGSKQNMAELGDSHKSINSQRFKAVEKLKTYLSQF